MRPKVSLGQKRRLFDVARDVGDMPEDREPTFSEALETVLSHVEGEGDTESDEDTVEVPREMWELVQNQQQQQSDPFGGTTVSRRQSGDGGFVK